jgi:hypothetical protein
MLIGDVTRRKAGDGVSFVHHEVSVIRRLKLPVVFANLNQSRMVEAHRLPAALAEQYTVSVSFQPKIIMHALDSFVDEYATNIGTKSGPHQYPASVYTGLGL